MKPFRALLAIWLIGTVAAPSPAVARQKPSPGPPIELDFDMNDIPEPKVRRNSQYYDFFDATFFQQAKQAFDIPRHVRKRPAANANAVDQVPDSSWFTNRNGRRPMSLEEIKRGSNTPDGPDPQGPWIVSRKTSGITPGFRIRDARGQRYGIKFDPPDYPEMASGAEVVATKLYHASGYNTPENYIVRFRPEILQIAPDATVVDWRGAERRMTAKDLDDVLSKVPRLPDGTVRALASKWLSGKPQGPFRYYGLRQDDPNDWIPHEHRRELRGLRVIASWLNDNDIREQNTLDMYVTQDGRRFLRHYLIDFGSALGSETLFPNTDRVGFEYILDAGEISKAFLSLGAHNRPWGHRRTILYKSIGYIESEMFHPGRWKPNYPIIAFENMTSADAYWAAKIVMSFTDEQIRAAVDTAEYSDPAAADYLSRILMERRDKIGRYWFIRAGGVDNFRVVADAGRPPVLPFDDLVARHGFATPAERVYRYRVLRDERRTPWQELSQEARLAVPLGATEPRGVQVVEVQVRDRKHSPWSPAIAIHLGEEEGRLRILGWVRADK